MASTEFQVPGMCSRTCVRAISRSVSDVPGVRTVEANVNSATIKVTGTAETAAVMAAIRRAGYDVTVTEVTRWPPKEDTP